MNHQNFGFVEFASELDADYATKIMNMVKLYNKPIRVNKVSAPWLTRHSTSLNSMIYTLFVGLCR
jgi:RNA recognition motif-containing protein